MSHTRSLFSPSKFSHKRYPNLWPRWSFYFLPSTATLTLPDNNSQGGKERLHLQPILGRSLSCLPSSAPDSVKIQGTVDVHPTQERPLRATCPRSPTHTILSFASIPESVLSTGVTCPSTHCSTPLHTLAGSGKSSYTSLGEPSMAIAS
jgi:hypothetical protein